MKFIYIAATLVTLVAAELKTPDIIDIEYLKTIDINELVDRFTPQIAQFIVNNGLDPLKLPSTELRFWTPSPSVSPTGYEAFLALSSGTLERLSCLERQGDATLTYEDKIVQLDLGIEFRLLKGAYDYDLRLLILSQDGRITVLAENVRAKVSIVFDTADYTLALDKLELQTSGHINVIVQSKAGWVNWIITSIANAVVPFFKSTITETVRVEAANAIRSFFDDVNRKIHRDVLTYIFEYELITSLFNG